MARKGIVLAGGRGRRLHPLTLATSKQLLPVYDKPMVYYPLSVLMLSGIRDVLIISTPRDLPRFAECLGDGATLGIRISYAEQPVPNGIPEAFRIGADFIAADPVTLILGDNIFFGQGLVEKLQAHASDADGATLFAYRVKNPDAYGVVTFGLDGKPISIDEKPSQPTSHFAVTGLYFYSNDVIKRAANLRPSERGELEISDLNRGYLKEGRLAVDILGRGNAWLDMGTHDSLLQAANYIQTIDQRQGLKVACLEEIAWRSRWIDDSQLLRLSQSSGTNEYGAYLKGLLELGH
jgi:glucose-1-phosphate thymidylyltransferase